MNQAAAEGRAEGALIVHINGPFGIGKTTVANELVKALPSAMLFDPEVVGGLVRALTSGVRTGDEDTDDFQDIAVWRHLTAETAAALWRRYQRPLIMPMTIWRADYLDEIYSALRRANMRVEAFCLTGSMATVQTRLQQRGDQVNPWLTRVTEACRLAFSEGGFGRRVDTDGRQPQGIAAEILDVLVGRQTAD